MSTSRQDGMLRLRHLAEFTEAKGEDLAEQRARFHRLAREDAAPRAVSSFNLFQTPEPIAERMAAMLPLVGRILEPSAGLGRLYRAIRKLSACHVTLVEQSPECCAELYREIDEDSACHLVQGDFLSFAGKFDTIVMNPPFKMGTDVKHILHALSLLAPGGRLVSLCYAGSKQHAKLKPIADSWEILPSGSFKSEGTDADIALLTLSR